MSQVIILGLPLPVSCRMNYDVEPPKVRVAVDEGFSLLVVNRYKFFSGCQKGLDQIKFFLTEPSLNHCGHSNARSGRNPLCPPKMKDAKKVPQYNRVRGVL